MYRILCFGDSNTWGYNPVNGLRFSEKERWPGVLSRTLGDGFRIVEDGLNGRRVLDSRSSFETSLNENGPLDVIIIFLGVNDICFESDIRIDDILAGISEMIRIIRGSRDSAGDIAAEIILIGAVPINEVQVEDCLYCMEAEKIVGFSEGLRHLAETEGCGYIDSGRIIRASELDGIHLEASEHRKLGLFIADYARTFLTNANLNNSRKNGN